MCGCVSQLLRYCAVCLVSYNLMPHTRSKAMPSSSDIVSQINSSGLNRETKQIFQLMIEYFNSIIKGKDSKISSLEQKLESNLGELQLKHDSLQNELQDYKAKYQTLSEKTIQFDAVGVQASLLNEKVSHLITENTQLKDKVMHVGLSSRED